MSEESPYTGYQKFTPAGLSDEGGGDVACWHDYIREVVEAANDHGEWSAQRGYAAGKADGITLAGARVTASNPYPPQKTVPTGRDYHDVWEEGWYSRDAIGRATGGD